MGALESLGLAMGAAFAAGLNLYATVATLGLLHRFEVIRLPGNLEVLSHPVVLGVAIVLYAVEFIADKIPYVDNVWDVIHTFIRPPSAALLAWSALSPTALSPDGAGEPLRLVAALLAGGVALTSHGAKATTRAGVNTSPEPVSNWLLSLVEDGFAVGLAWLAVTHPLLTIVLVAILAVLCVWLVVKLFGLLRRALRRMFRREAPGVPPASVTQ